MSSSTNQYNLGTSPANLIHTDIDIYGNAKLKPIATRPISDSSRSSQTGDILLTRQQYIDLAINSQLAATPNTGGTSGATIVTVVQPLVSQRGGDVPIEPTTISNVTQS